MMVTPDRIAYSGLLGPPSQRLIGAVTLYVALDSPFHISLEGGPEQSAWLAMVLPNEEHRISSNDRLVRDVLIEPESVALPLSLGLPQRILANREGEYHRFASAFDRWLCEDRRKNIDSAAFDQLFFGSALAPRQLDPRIERVVRRIRSCPHEQFSAAECARLTGLSFSRFVHLFKEEIGMTFRAFCAWKRARAVLPWMTTRCNLTHVALETGYPDSTHFSHSIRRIFGHRPRDIVAGSRRLALQCMSTPAQSASFS